MTFIGLGPDQFMSFKTELFTRRGVREPGGWYTRLKNHPFLGQPRDDPLFTGTNRVQPAPPVCAFPVGDSYVLNLLRHPAARQ
jgi:hypothetical protein